MTKESQTVFLIEQLQPRWLKTNSEKILYVLGVFLFTFLVLNLGNFYVYYLYLTNPSAITQAMIKEPNLSGSQSKDILRVAMILPIFIELVFGFMMAWKLINNKHFFLCRCVKRIANIDFLKNIFFAKYFVPLGDLFQLYYNLLIRNYLVPDIEPIETVNWSLGNALKSLKSHFIAVFILAVIFALVLSVFISLLSLNVIMKMGRPMILLFVVIVPIMALISTIYLEPIVFVLSGINIETSVEKTIFPNQGIKNSVKNIIPLSFLGFLIGAYTSIIMMFYQRISSPLGIGTGILTWVLLFAFLAGGACIKHIVLRIILCRKGYIPWDYASFLNYAAERILLRKVGGSYIFIHRMLQEHFAFRETTLQRSSFYAPVQAIPVEPFPPSVQNHIVCTNCGHDNSVNSNFCIKCGTKLTKSHI